MLVPLRLSHLGYGGAAIGAVFLCSAALECGQQLLVGRVSDRHGTALPILVGLAASAVLAALLPWPGSRCCSRSLVVLASLAFGAFFTPALTLLTNVSEARGLDYGYAFALVNLAWAPGETLGRGRRRRTRARDGRRRPLPRARRVHLHRVVRALSGD